MPTVLVSVPCKRLPGLCKKWDPQWVIQCWDLTGRCGKPWGRAWGYPAVGRDCP